MEIMLKVSVDFFAMTNIVDYDGMVWKVKFVDNAVISDSAPPGSLSS